jgi:hypothetical protein
MFIAPLFTITSCRNSQDALQLMNGLGKCDIYITLYIYIMKYYSAIKNNGIMSFAGRG